MKVKVLYNSGLTKLDKIRNKIDYSTALTIGNVGTRGKLYLLDIKECDSGKEYQLLVDEDKKRWFGDIEPGMIMEFDNSLIYNTPFYAVLRLYENNKNVYMGITEDNKILSIDKMLYDRIYNRLPCNQYGPKDVSETLDYTAFKKIIKNMEENGDITKVFKELVDKNIFTFLIRDDKKEAILEGFVYCKNIEDCGL